MLNNNKFVYTITVLFIVGALLYSPDQEDCFCNHGYGLDATEYHLLSANVALHNVFPIYGFVGEMADYKLCKENIDLAEYYNILANTGPVVFSGRPPLYPLIMGLVYKLIGFSPQALYSLNFISIWLTALLLAITLFVTRGAILASIVSVVYLYITVPFAHVNDAEAFTRLPYFIAILTLIWAEYYNKKRFYFIAGIAIALALLTKGTLLIFAALFILIIFYRAYSNRSLTILNGIIYLCAIAMIIIPWSLFINHQLKKSENERSNWAVYMNKAIPDVSVQKSKDLFNASINWYSKEAVYYFIKIHQTRYVADSAFVIITNQLNRSIILSDHNEFCLDGDYHPEFEAITTSYHNRFSKKDEWVWKSVARFYASDPVFAPQVLYAKLCALGRTSTNLYFLSIVLMTLALCFRHHIISDLTAKLFAVAYTLIYFTALHYGLLYLVIWIAIICLLISLGIILLHAEKGLLSIFTLLALSFTLLALMIYGDPRFIDALDAVWVLAATLSFTYILGINLKQKKHPLL